MISRNHSKDPFGVKVVSLELAQGEASPAGWVKDRVAVGYDDMGSAYPSGRTRIGQNIGLIQIYEVADREEIIERKLTCRAFSYHGSQENSVVGRQDRVAMMPAQAPHSSPVTPTAAVPPKTRSGLWKSFSLQASPPMGTLGRRRPSTSPRNR
jgi:hypothetical protein